MTDPSADAGKPIHVDETAKSVHISDDMSMKDGNAYMSAEEFADELGRKCVFYDRQSGSRFFDCPTAIPMIERYTDAIRQSERAKAGGLVEALQEMITAFQNVPETAQSCFDEPSEPKTSWDYQAFQALHNANKALTKFNNEET